MLHHMSAGLMRCKAVPDYQSLPLAWLLRSPPIAPATINWSCSEDTARVKPLQRIRDTSLPVIQGTNSK